MELIVALQWVAGMLLAVSVALWVLSALAGVLLVAVALYIGKK